MPLWDPELWEQWVNDANLMLLAKLRRRVSRAIDWTAMGMSCRSSTPSRRLWIARPRAGGPRGRSPDVTRRPRGQAPGIDGRAPPAGASSPDSLGFIL